ncbi:hypothetical protein [Psychrobium sp. 1_MG-2023]|uniref:hypothetical protein n=1 Tax=Psychrobium sp. 1_MG-2023 TaxID=3062624 RepID=UPI000C33CEB2|nr:hypothetical protein [Psychrobium sp. 1_MG-2023]MDP2560860.1 hypothetical protein [Psychrobium sp. 1_MG-2023]PKF56733.1 hypothetical protein CW748_09655 [Alteromonadales bacterium alter-6D02]
MMKKVTIESLGLFEFLVAIIVVLLLIMSTVSLQLGQQNTIHQVSFAMNKQNFNQNISLIKTQWLIEGRPKQLDFTFYGAQQEVLNSATFNMSKQGWASINQRHESLFCRELWAKVTNTDAYDNKSKQLVIKKQQKEDDIVCQFCDAENSEECFEYSINHGVHLKGTE